MASSAQWIYVGVVGGMALGALLLTIALLAFNAYRSFRDLSL